MIYAKLLGYRLNIFHRIINLIKKIKFKNRHIVLWIYTYYMKIYVKIEKNKMNIIIINLNIAKYLNRIFKIIREKISIMYKSKKK